MLIPKHGLAHEDRELGRIACQCGKRFNDYSGGIGTARRAYHQHLQICARKLAIV